MALEDCPIGNTCPTIDGGISDCTQIAEITSDISSTFEELRNANSNLRDWGQNMYDYAAELEVALANEEEKVSDLSYELTLKTKEE